VCLIKQYRIILNSIIQYHLKTKVSRVFAVFVDLSAAFDSIDHQKLWDKLVAIGLSSKFIKTIQNIYCHVKAKIRTQYGESEYFPLEKAVLQGETLSPKLFTFFMEDLVTTLHNSDIPSIKVHLADIHLLMYADDIVILASNPIDLQSKIELVENFFCRNDLTVNLDKTKMVIFRNNNRRKLNQPLVYCNDETIEVVDKYTYLGVTSYGKIDYNEMCNNFVNKALVAEKNLFSLFYKSKIKTLDSRIKLFDSMVKSVLMYCSNIWDISVTQRLTLY